MKEIKWIFISLVIALIIVIVTLLLSIEPNDSRLVLKQVFIILYLIVLIGIGVELYRIDDK